MDKKGICKLREIHQAIARLDEDFSRKFGLGLNEAMVLCMLSERKSASAGELSRKLGLSRSNMSKVLSAVEQLGYVERTIGADDKRVMFFSITRAGKACLERIDCGTLSVPAQMENLFSN